MVLQSSRPFKRPKCRYIQLELPFDKFDIVLHQIEVISAAILVLSDIIDVTGLYRINDYLQKKLCDMKYQTKDHLTMVDSSSQTIPANVLTPRDIIKRYAVGADIPAAFYESDDDPDNLSDDEKMDLDIPEDDLVLHQFILEESEIARARASEGSGNSDYSGNNTDEDSDQKTAESEPTENQQATKSAPEAKTDDPNN